MTVSLAHFIKNLSRWIPLRQPSALFDPIQVILLYRREAATYLTSFILAL